MKVSVTVSGLSRLFGNDLARRRRRGPRRRRRRHRPDRDARPPRDGHPDRPLPLRRVPVPARRAVARAAHGARGDGVGDAAGAARDRRADRTAAARAGRGPHGRRPSTCSPAAGSISGSAPAGSARSSPSAGLPVPRAAADSHGRHGPRVPGAVGAGAAGLVLVRQRRVLGPVVRAPPGAGSGSRSGTAAARPTRPPAGSSSSATVGSRSASATTRSAASSTVSGPTYAEHGRDPATLGVRTTIRVVDRRRRQGRRRARRSRPIHRSGRARGHRGLGGARPLHPDPGRHRLLPRD